MILSLKFNPAHRVHDNDRGGRCYDLGNSMRLFSLKGCLNMTQKECFKCRQTKSLSEFYKHPQMGDGHLNKCKECTKNDASDNYSAKRKRYAEYEKERFQRPDRKQKTLEYQRNRRARNPQKYYAHSAVHNALSAGVLEKEPCEICGNQKVEAHHDDYSKPLDVRWLCRKHHLKEHGKESYSF